MRTRGDGGSAAGPLPAHAATRRTELVTPGCLCAFALGSGPAFTPWLIAVVALALASGALLVQRRRHRRAMHELAGRVDEDDRSSRAQVLGLELALARLTDVLASMSEGVIVVDPVGEIVAVNAAACRLLGFDTELEACGVDFLARLPESERARVEQLLGRVEREQRGERMRGLELAGRSCELSVAPLRHVRGDDEHRCEADLDGGSVVILHDVSEAMQLQRMKDEFLSSVSHELRTPLTSIRSYAEILLHMTPDDRETWQEFLGIVNIEAERLTRLVNEVLDLAKMEAGEMEFTFEAIEIGPLLCTVQAVFAPIFEERELRFELDCADDLPAVCADHDRLHQVLTNILGNAVKFVPAGGVLRVSVQSEPETELVHFCVEDSGPGIVAEERERVFEKFKQVGGTLVDKPRGTGLGLPLCRQMLHAMSGDIWCDASATLGGAAFHFRVPASATRARPW